MTNDSAEWKLRYEQLYEDYTEFQSQSNEIEKELESQNTQLQEQIKQVTKKAQINQDKYNDEIQALQSRLSTSQSQVDSLKETLSITQSDCERWRSLARQLEQSVEGFESKLRILTAKQESMSEELDDKTELLIMARAEFEEVTNDYAVKQSKQRAIIQSLKSQIEELMEQHQHRDLTDSITITAPNHFTHVPFNLTHLSEELMEEYNEISSPQLDTPSHLPHTQSQANHLSSHKQSIQTAPVSPSNHVSFHRHDHNRHHHGSSTPNSYSRHSVESDHSIREVPDESKTYSSPRLAEFIQRTDGLQHVQLHTTYRRVRANSHTHILTVTPTHAAMTRSHSRNDISTSYHQRAKSSIEPLSPAYPHPPLSPTYQSTVRSALPCRPSSSRFNESSHCTSTSCSKHEQCNFLSECKQPIVDHCDHAQTHTPARQPVPR